MRNRGTSRHCVTNMAADEEAAIAATIAAIFLLNKEEEERMETVMDLPKVLPDFFSPAGTYLNPQRSSRRLPSWIFIRNILFILLLGAEWLKRCSVHSGIGMRNKKEKGAHFTL